MEIINNCLNCGKKLRKLQFLKNGKWGDGFGRKYHKSCWEDIRLEKQLEAIYENVKKNN